MTFNLEEFLESSDDLGTLVIVDGELKHYGTPGMKWGHRKAASRVSNFLKTNQSVRAQKAIISAVKNRRDAKPVLIDDKTGKIIKRNPKLHFRNEETGKTTIGRYPANSSSQHVHARELRGKKAHQLTNDELKSVTERLRLEQSFKEVSAKDRTAAQKIVSQIAAQAGKQVVSTLITTGVQAGLKAATEAAKSKK